MARWAMLGGLDTQRIDFGILLKQIEITQIIELVRAKRFQKH